MLNVIAHARNLGYIKCEDDLLQPLHMIQKLPDEKVLILTTGSQGEPMAAMTRIANGEHRQIKVRQGDTVVFSANPIPGNTIAVVNTIDKLMIKGAKVIYGKDQGIHVSGHGCQEDQKLMIGLTRPKFFLPVHGEHRMLVKHSQTAQSLGIPASNMVIIDNGDVVELTESSLRIAGKVPAGIELVDTSRSGVVNEKVLKERQQLAGEGIVTMAVAIDWSGELIARPQIHLRGVVTAVDSAKLQTMVDNSVTAVLRDRWKEFARPFGDNQLEVDWVGLQTQIERELQRMLRREFQSNPLLVFFMQNAEEPMVKTSSRTRRAEAAIAS
jgi:ribonuclease J